MCPLPCRSSSPLAALAAVVLISTCTATSAWAESGYYAAECSQVSPETWGICRRDGAHRSTEPYLSSLGRGDFVIPSGWLEAPAKPLEGQWKVHQGFDLPKASVPILVHDVDEDGLADIIYGNGHGYGLFWFGQRVDDDGKRTWLKHTIDYGSPKQASGVGIYFWVEDVTGDDRPDIVAPGKEGLYLFQNQ